MQTRFKDGSVMVCGGCSKDAELQVVGEKQSRKCSVGVAVGKSSTELDDQGRPKTIWCNVVAWHGLASILSLARKGDPVMVIGKLKTREYNGKEYTDLEAEYVSVASVSAVASHPATPPADTFQEVEDDGELPF